MKKVVRYFFYVIAVVFLLSGCNDKTNELDVPEIATQTQEYKLEYVRIHVLTLVEEFVNDNERSFMNTEFSYNNMGSVLKRTLNQLDDTYIVFECTYDNEGNLLSKTYPNEDQTLLYDKKGNITSFRAGGTVTLRERDEQGNVLSEKTFKDDVLIKEYNCSYKYDNKGLLICEAVQTTDYQEDKTYGYQNLYRYDGNDRLVHKCMVDETGFENNTYYDYNEKGMLLKEEHVSAYGNCEVAIYTYADDGKLLEKQTHLSDYSQRTVNTYDTMGNLIKHVYYQDDILMSTTEYEYSSVPGQIISKTIDNRGRKTYENFTYDDEGNVLTRTYTDTFNRTYRYKYTYTEMEIPGDFVSRVEAEQKEFTEEFLNKK